MVTKSTAKDPRRVEAGRKAAETRRANKAAAALRQQELEQENRGNLNWLPWLLFGLALVALVLVWRPWETMAANPDATGAGAGIENDPTPTPEADTPAVVPPTDTPATPVAPANNPEVNTNEPLNGTLDDFGVLTRYDDRFPNDGMIWDQSYNPGEITVGNMWATHDNGFVSQESCVVVYYIAPENGGRIRYTAWNGQAFEFDAGVISLNQAIAAMRVTLVNAHGCNADSIQYHELVRYGDPVK